MGYRDTYFNKNDAYDNNNGWYTCQKCGRKFRKGDMDIDHIIPQKFGGSSSEWNLQCICKHCNRSKQASMSDTPRDLFNSGKRILKREAGEPRCRRVREIRALRGSGRTRDSRPEKCRTSE